MSDRVLEIQSEARLSCNYIPSGRQLHRTPPLTSVKKQLDFFNEDSNEEREELQQSVETDCSDQEDDNQNTMFDFNTLGIKSEPDDPSAMLRGMTGYQLTQTDSEFMEKMRVEKLVKKLKGELEELQRSSVKERTLLKLMSVSRNEARAGLQTLPSGEDITEWVKVVLKITSPHCDVTDLNAKSLLAIVTRKDIERATDVKRMLIRVKTRMAHTRKLVTPPVTGQLEKLIALGQLEIQGLMRELPDLKSELSQQEEVYKALKMQLIAQEAPEVPAEEADAKRQATRPVKGRAKALGATEKLPNSTKRGKSTRSKLGDSLTVVKDDQGKMKPKSGAADQKRAGGPRQKAEAQELNSQESVRGRRKPPGPAAPQGKPQRPPGPAAPQGKPQRPPGPAAPQGKPQRPPGPAAPQGKPQRPPGPAAPQGKPQTLPGPAAPQGKPQRPPGPAAPQGKPQTHPGPAAPQRKRQRPADAGEALASSLQGRKRPAREEAQSPVLRRSKRIASRR